jgi:hypothetical protein
MGAKIIAAWTQHSFCKPFSNLRHHEIVQWSWERNCEIKPSGVSSCRSWNISSSHDSQTRKSKLGTVRWNRSCYRY